MPDMANVNKSERLVLWIVRSLVEFLERIAPDRREGRCNTARRVLVLGLRDFAGAIGISLSSTAPTWRDSSSVLILLSGLYLVLVAAYIAARVRVPLANTAEIIEFRDGVHGLLVWALSTLMTGLIALTIVQATPRVSQRRA